MTTITAEEIKGIREFYGLTQKSFAQVLGLGAASIVRYEQGSEPSRANANLIRAAKHPEFMKECLERDGDAIPEIQRDNAMRVVNACVSLEPDDDTISGSTSKMDEVYHYTIQQEVLNEQAANLIAEMISLKMSTGFRGAASDVLEALLDQLARLKPTIVSNETMDDEALAIIRGQLKCATNLFVRYQSEAVA